ncbi:MAG: hypothetical protein DI616_13050 [Paracoccus denitrificans]|uniref:Uncharacterized protein n=1 Tax=Paracoccus denitrificans TaxID=266 RepID=A0A533I6X9_PARDE|nr:MAG: hypothetical protein DI616_13050 [Paracoccus denitrificans]
MPTGFMFITFEIGIFDLIGFGLYIVAVYVLQALGTVLGFAAALAAFRGRYKRAVLLALAAVAALAAAYGPGLWGEFRARSAISALESAEITRTVPNLTGKTVAYVPERQLNDVALDCEAIVNRSGAAEVYLVEPFYPPGANSDEEPVDLTKPLDLMALIQGPAALYDTPPAYPDWPAGSDSDQRRYCGVGTDAKPPRRIDYIVIEGGYYDATAPFADQLAVAALEGLKPRLDWFFGPVPDPNAFLLSAEGADLLRFEMSVPVHSIPYSGFKDSQVDSDAGLKGDDVIRAALCRDETSNCAYR